MNVPASALSSAAQEGEPEKPVPLLRHRALLGLLSGLFVGITLATVFHSQARDKVVADAQQRIVLSEASALAELAGHALDSADESRVQTLLEDWRSRRAGQPRIRVVRLAGARLLASTDPGDLASGDLPRRLGETEKALYDLADELRAAADTNRDEGVVRKRQVDVSEDGRDRLTVAAPYVADGRIAGMLLLERDVPPVATSGHVLSVVMTALLPLLLFVALGRFLYRPVGPQVDARNGRGWALFVLAAVTFLISAWAFSNYQGERLGALQSDLSASLAEHYVALVADARDSAQRAGLHLDAQRETARWDIDQYQRPLGLMTATGEPAAEAQAGEIAYAKAAVASRARWSALLGLALLAFVALGFGRQLRETLIEHRSAYLYVVPAMLGMLVLVFFPFFYGIALSFTDQTNYTINEPLTEVFVGLKNYITILGDVQVFERAADGVVWNYSNFYWTLFITVCWTVFNVTIGVSVGMLLALALNTPGLRMKTLYRVLLVLPWAIPNYITALTWKGMFHPQFGVINQVVQMFGGQPVAWFDGVFSAFITGLATNGWLSFPFMMVVILGALQSIPSDMYEAATVEGASRGQQFRHITLPLLKPTLVPAIIISVVWTFNMFNVIYLVSEGQPAGANEILITEAYKLAFEKYQLGYSAAYSVVIFMILLVYGVFQNRVTRATEAANA